jgi:hypothetical protein
MVRQWGENLVVVTGLLVENAKNIFLLVTSNSSNSQTTCYS